MCRVLCGASASSSSCSPHFSFFIFSSLISLQPPSAFRSQLSASLQYSSSRRHAHIRRSALADPSLLCTIFWPVIAFVLQVPKEFFNSYIHLVPSTQISIMPKNGGSYSGKDQW